MLALITEDATGRNHPATLVAGVDEAGRGPLCGPVVAAAALIPDGCPADLLGMVRDSKAISSEARRDACAAGLREHALIGVGSASPQEIDDINILRATMLAMQRAVADLSARSGLRPALVLVDGNKVPVLGCPARPIVRGDATCLQIAAASIVAKTTRDALMKEIAVAFPGYGIERHMGYPTPEHVEAVRRLGPTPHHRRSFRTIAELLPKRTLFAL